MHKTAISERELARNIVRKLPWLTASISTVAFLLTALILNNEQDAAFSLHLKSDSILAALAFNSVTPLRQFGLTLLTSFFAHTDWNHFFSNVVWLVLFGSAIELRQKKLRLLNALAIGHLIAVIGGYVTATAFAGPELLLGMSGGVCFVALMWLAETQSIARSISVLLLLGGLSSFQSVGFLMTHVAPALGGLLLGMFFKKRTAIKTTETTQRSL
jgi:membrane associated rhomboid family serine protease